MHVGKPRRLFQRGAGNREDGEVAVNALDGRRDGARHVTVRAGAGLLAHAAGLQLSGPALADRIRRDGIRSVLNLRGRNDGSDWYETERAVSDRLGIKHLDFRMSAQAELDQPEVEALLAVMRDAPKPMLIHCMGGADRTGLAAALYLAAAGRPAEAEALPGLRLVETGLPLDWRSVLGVVFAQRSCGPRTPRT